MQIIISQKLEANQAWDPLQRSTRPSMAFPRTRSMVTPVLQGGAKAVQMGRTANQRRSAQARGLRRIRSAGGSL